MGRLKLASVFACLRFDRVFARLLRLLSWTVGRSSSYLASQLSASRERTSASKTGSFLPAKPPPSLAPLPHPSFPPLPLAPPSHQRAHHPHPLEKR